MHCMGQRRGSVKKLCGDGTPDAENKLKPMGKVHPTSRYGSHVQPRQLLLQYGHPHTQQTIKSLFTRALGSISVLPQLEPREDG